jgi:uncharacterized membrane protein
MTHLTLFEVVLVAISVISFIYGLLKLFKLYVEDI